MTLERYPSAMDDARAACRRRESTGTRGAVAGFPVISMRLALFFVALSLAPRAAAGEGNIAGESCSSDSDCVSNNMCAGNVCCSYQRGYSLMGNCTQCHSEEYTAGTPYNKGECSQCASGTELVWGGPSQENQCGEICDNTKYRSGLYCYNKAYDGNDCSADNRCLSGSCKGGLLLQLHCNRRRMHLLFIGEWRLLFGKEYR